MRSNIINMVEKVRDKEDQRLDELFAFEPIADEGFSDQVSMRIRRRFWIERLTLPVAALIGAVFAFRPLADVVTMLLRNEPTRKLVQIDVPAVPVEMLSTQNMMLAGLLLAAGFWIYQLLEE